MALMCGRLNLRPMRRLIHQVSYDSLVVAFFYFILLLLLDKQVFQYYFVPLKLKCLNGSKRITYIV